MLTLDHQTAGFQDYSMSAAIARVAMVQPSCGLGAERSDPYTEWALRFDQDLKRADDRIRAWSRDATVFADEGIDSPSREAFRRAAEIISHLKTLVMDRVALTTATSWNLKGAVVGSGGEICLEFGSGPFAVTYQIEPDGTVIGLLFKNNQLIRRDVIPQ